MLYLSTLNCSAFMPKKYTEIVYTYRLNDHSRYVCVSHDTPYLAADVLRALGIDYLPDCVEFVRCSLGEGKSIWIYCSSLLIKFKFHNLTINDLCTNPRNSWR